MMAALALTLSLAFFALALFGRVWLRYRRTGDHGIRRLTSESPPVQWLSSALLMMAVAIFLFSPLTRLFSLLPGFDLPRWTPLAGIGLAVAGMTLTLTAQSQMGTSWRMGVDPSERVELVTSGLFRAVRNPIYSGVGLFATGQVLLVPNSLGVLGLVVGWIGLELQVRRVEEPFLLSKKPRTYGDYARRVGRFVPGIGTMR